MENQYKHIQGDLNGTHKNNFRYRVGPRSVEVGHLPVITLANSNRPMTNHTLGTWLYFMRHVNYEDHLVMIDHDLQMR